MNSAQIHLTERYSATNLWAALVGSVGVTAILLMTSQDVCPCRIRGVLERDPLRGSLVCDSPRDLISADFPTRCFSCSPWSQLCSPRGRLSHSMREGGVSLVSRCHQSVEVASGITFRAFLFN